jgi:hypothetical protein
MARRPSWTAEFAGRQPLRLSRNLKRCEGHLIGVPKREQFRTRLAAAKPTIDELLATRERMNRASVEFLKTDLETALTFVKIARQTRDESRRERTCRAARKAYETLTKFVNKVNLDAENGRQVGLGLKQLKSELESLGEVF